MAPPEIAVAVVGEGASSWQGLGAAGEVELFPVEPNRFRSVESGLNHALAQTAAPYLFVCGADDQVDAAGLERLVETLRAAPQSAVGAVGTVLEAGPNDQVRRLTPRPVSGRRALLALARVPPLALLRTAALRQIGGWRAAEAAWTKRSDHHRGVLARLLDGGSLLAVPAHVGQIDQENPPRWPLQGPLSEPPRPMSPVSSRVGAAPLSESVVSVAQQLLYHLVSLRIRGAKTPLVGRIAAITAGLLTLAGEGAHVTVVPLDRILAIGTIAQSLQERAEPARKPEPIVAEQALQAPESSQLTVERLSPDQVIARAQPRSHAGTRLVRVHQATPQSWPSPSS